MKKALTIFLILIIITQLLCACSGEKNNNTYLAAIQNVCFSAENENLCFALSNQKTVILEKDNVMIDLHDYSYLDDYYGIEQPFILNEKLYYITSSHENTMCISCLDINDLKHADILTPKKDNIYSFTVFENNIYYYAYHNGESAIYSFNLKTKKENVILSTDDLLYNFFVSDDYIIFGNRKYDLNKKQLYTLSIELNEKDIYGLGIINNIYYCGYTNRDSLKEEIYSINLKNNMYTFVCELPIGVNISPRLYDNKILYVAPNEKNDMYLTLNYYDLNTNEEKIVFDKTSDCYYYSLLHDYVDNYDSFYYNGNFYMWYPETIVKVNNKNEDKIFGLSSYNTDNGYIGYKNSWLTYEEYLKEMNN